jgi:hypothetical protein
MNTTDIQATFVTPTKQEHLGGKVGISLRDIAKSLNIKYHDAKEKFYSKDFQEMCNYLKLQTTVITVVHKINGLPFFEPILELAAAKLYVAKYNNPVGWAYSYFLIRFNDQGQELLQENSELRRRLHELSKTRKRYVQQGEKKILVTIAVDRITDLFGQETLVHRREQIQVSRISKLEAMMARAEHCARVAKGLAKRAVELQEMILEARIEKGDRPADMTRSLLPLPSNVYQLKSQG